MKELLTLLGGAVAGLAVSLVVEAWKRATSKEDEEIVELKRKIQRMEEASSLVVVTQTRHDERISVLQAGFEQMRGDIKHMREAMDNLVAISNERLAEIALLLKGQR